MTSDSIDSEWITCDNIKEVVMYCGSIKNFHKWHEYKTSEEIMQWITNCVTGKMECDCILCKVKGLK